MTLRRRAASRPSRGKRGRRFRRAISGIPTARLRDRLVQMAANAGLSVIVVDPRIGDQGNAAFERGRDGSLRAAERRR
jgi:hypothetical protein